MRLKFLEKISETINIVQILSDGVRSDAYNERQLLLELRVEGIVPP